MTAVVVVEVSLTGISVTEMKRQTWFTVREEDDVLKQHHLLVLNSISLNGRHVTSDSRADNLFASANRKCPN